MSDTVKLRMTSFINVSFDHVIDSHVSWDEWNDMTDEEQDEIMQEILNCNVEIQVVER